MSVYTSDLLSLSLFSFLISHFLSELFYHDFSVSPVLDSLLLWKRIFFIDHQNVQGFILFLNSGMKKSICKNILVRVNEALRLVYTVRFFFAVFINVSRTAPCDVNLINLGATSTLTCADNKPSSASAASIYGVAAATREKTTKLRKNGALPTYQRYLCALKDSEEEEEEKKFYFHDKILPKTLFGFSSRVA